MRKIVAVIMVVYTILAFGNPVCAQAEIGVAQAADSNLVSVTVNIGKTQMSVAVTVKILDCFDNINYITMGYTDATGAFSFSYYNEADAGTFHIIAKTAELVLETDYIKTQNFTVPITVEGENYKDIGFQVDTFQASAFSNSTAVGFTAVPDSGVIYEVTYTVDVPQRGAYRLVTASSEVNAGFTSDYSVQINGEETVDVNLDTDATYLSSVDAPVLSGLLENYDLGDVYLKTGMNTITYMIDTDDLRDDGTLAFFIDKFTLERSPFGIKKLDPAGPCGVYEKASPVQFDAVFNCPAWTETDFYYVVTDYWGNEVARDTLVCKDSAQKCALNLGAYETGWYRLQFFAAGTETVIQETSFSVVPPLADRVSEDTPFAADFASFLLPDLPRVKEAAMTLKYAGIQWVRERYKWGSVQPDENTHHYDDLDARMQIFADEGVNVLNMFGDFPSWTDGSDLFRIYNFQKEMAQRYNGKIQAFEIWNEQDSGFGEGSGDAFSAMYKAGALGISAAGTNAKAAFGGLCLTVKNNVFIDLMMKNSVNDFSSFYNLHTHSTWAQSPVLSINADIISSHRVLKLQNAQNQPYWITEAGLAMPVSSEGVPTKEKLASQAKYAVISTAQSLATGVSKHFWFVWPGYVENGNEYGTLTKKMATNPAYASEAVMTHVLGKGEFKGRMEVQDGEGYVFNNGDNDVLVVWSSASGSIGLKSEGSLRVIDMMGRETSAQSVNQEVKVDISDEPRYIVFNGEMPVENYYPTQYHFDEDRQLAYSDAERVVLQQHFENQDAAVAKIKGYELQPYENMEMTVKVYNFNEKEMTGTIRGELSGYEVRISDSTVTLAPMSGKTLSVTLVPVDEPVYEETQYLKFTGDFDGNLTSPSVCALYLENEQIVVPTALFNGQGTSGNWDISNTSGAATVQQGSETGTLTFDVSFPSGSGWFYPLLTVPQPEALQDTTGVVFWVKADTDSVGGGNHNIFAYLSDGRTYFLGNLTGITLKDEWVQVKRKWSDFVRFSTPLGAVDVRPFDQTLIDKISVGGNFNKTAIRYSIKDFGYYIDENSIEKEKITFSQLESMKTYQADELSDITVTLPDVSYHKITVMLTDDVIEPVFVSQNTLRLNLSNLSKGEYTLHVICEDANGFKTSESVRFLVSEQDVNNIFIQGENLPNQAEGYFSQEDINYIGGGYGGFCQSAACEMKISFHAQKSGMYALRFQATQNSSAYAQLSPYQVTINGAAFALLNPDETQGDFGTYSINVYLNKGENTIQFTPTQQRAQDGKYVIYLDYLFFQYLYSGAASLSGANYSAKNSSASVQLTGEQIVVSGSTFSVPSVEYVVYAPAAGEYTVDAVSSAVNNTATTDWIMVVNDQKEYPARGNVSLISDADGMYAYRYTYTKTVTLQQGYNKVKFMRDISDLTPFTNPFFSLTKVNFNKDVLLDTSAYEQVSLLAAYKINDGIVARLASNSKTDFVLIAASYAGNVLQNISIVPVTDMNRYVYHEVTVPLHASGEAVKVFAWDNTETMQALSTALEVE